MDMPVIIDVSQNAERTRAGFNLSVDNGLDIFEGHFKGAPIVPGVVQILWALQLSRLYLRPLLASQITHVEALKFHHVIVPDIRLVLELEFNGHKLLFKYFSETIRYSSGRIVTAT